MSYIPIRLYYFWNQFFEIISPALNEEIFIFSQKIERERA